MAGISSNALNGMNYQENRKKYNGNELQSKEFGDGAGLEWTDFNARTYDQQLGRFLQIDPWVEVGTQEMLTPYQFAYNNPVRYNDPDGKCPLCPALPFIPAIGEGLAYLGAATGITAVAVKVYNQVIEPALQSGAVGSMDHMPSFVVQRPSRVKSEEAKAPQTPAPAADNKTEEAVQKGDYSHLKEPNKVGPGLETTRAQRKRILEENKKQNGGQLVSDGDGRPLNPPSKSEKGKPADMNQAEVDHKVPRADGGSNSNANQRVISKEENLKKGRKPLE